MPGVFSRGGSGRSRADRPNPLAGRLADSVPGLVLPAGAQRDVDPDDLADADDLVGPDGPGRPAAPPTRRPRPAARTAATGLAAAAPARAGAAALFSLPAGYNLPTPDPFARNRQRVGRAFGQVVVTQGVVLLQLRRKRVSRLLPPVRVEPADIRLASPTETDFMGNNRGVVLERHDGEHLYVWVDEPAPLLIVLSVQGFTVGQEPVPVTRAG